MLSIGGDGGADCAGLRFFLGRGGRLTWRGGSLIGRGVGVGTTCGIGTSIRGRSTVLISGRGGSMGGFTTTGIGAVGGGVEAWGGFAGAGVVATGAGGANPVIGGSAGFMVELEV